MRNPASRLYVFTAGVYCSLTLSLIAFLSSKKIMVVIIMYYLFFLRHATKIIMNLLQVEVSRS